MNPDALADIIDYLRQETTVSQNLYREAGDKSSIEKMHAYRSNLETLQAVVYVACGELEDLIPVKKTRKWNPFKK